MTQSRNPSIRFEWCNQRTVRYTVSRSARQAKLNRRSRSDCRSLNNSAASFGNSTLGFREISTIPLMTTSTSSITFGGAAFAPQGTGPMGYVRGDSVTAVVYRTQDRMHELAFVDDRCVHTDLSRAAGTLTDAGSPFAYVRSDGVSSIVYCRADRHIHELALLPT